MILPTESGTAVLTRVFITVLSAKLNEHSLKCLNHPKHAGIEIATMANLCHFHREGVTMIVRHAKIENRKTRTGI
jgi:hypothetical protein